MQVTRRDPDAGYYSSSFWIPKSRINVDSVKNALTIAVKKGKGEDLFVFAWKETAAHLIVPRSFFRLLDFSGMFPIYDVRPQSYPTVNITSKIELDKIHPHLTYQRDSVRAMVASEGGVLQLGCGKGKTAIALEAIASVGGPALVIVDNTQLVHQWLGEIEQFLDVPGGVGLVQGPSREWHKSLVIATYQTLANIADELDASICNRFATVIFEEAHHLGAETYIRAAGIFPGRRYGLTATPERADGATKLYMSFLGPILFKDLTTELQAQAVFLRTGLTVNLKDAEELREVVDSTSEVHYGLLCAALGRKRARLDLVLDEIRKAELEGRKLLVLSNSREELLNLFCLYGGDDRLFSDIARPTAEELGLEVPPVFLTARRHKQLEKDRGRLFARLDKAKPAEKAQVQFALNRVLLELKAHESAIAVERAYEKKQLDFIREAVARNTVRGGGLLIGSVPVKTRAEMLHSRTVVFAIMKFGKEALNKKTLDTVMVLNPIAQEGALWQIVGRVLRGSVGKKSPVAVFLEDDVGIIKGMCNKLRKFLRDRPEEDGGAIESLQLGYSATSNFWKKLK